jgi:hypothetical protein
MSKAAQGRRRIRKQPDYIKHVNPRKTLSSRIVQHSRAMASIPNNRFDPRISAFPSPNPHGWALFASRRESWPFHRLQASYPLAAGLT